MPTYMAQFPHISRHPQTNLTKPHRWRISFPEAEICPQNRACFQTIPNHIDGASQARAWWWGQKPVSKCACHCQPPSACWTAMFGTRMDGASQKMSGVWRGFKAIDDVIHFWIPGKMGRSLRCEAITWQAPSYWGRGVASHLRTPPYVYSHIYIYTHSIWCTECKQAKMTGKNLHAI